MDVYFNDYQQLSVVNREQPAFDPEPTTGFVSPAADYREAPVNILRELIVHPAATHVVRVEEGAIPDAGIFAGDYVLVDRALRARDGSIVLCALDGALTLRRISIRPDGVYIVTRGGRRGTVGSGQRTVDSNEKAAGDDFSVWGVVAWTIHPVRAGM